MDLSTTSINTTNSSISKETDANSSFESQTPITEDTKHKIISSIASNLKDIIEDNKQKIGEKFINHDIFYLEAIPKISLEDYIKRIYKYTKMNISSLIISVIYIDKFCENYKYILSYNNIYRLLLVSILVSIKFNEDFVVTGNTYAKIAGVSCADLNFLEYNLCTAMDFNFNIENDYYQQYFQYFSKFVTK